MKKSILGMAMLIALFTFLIAPESEAQVVFDIKWSEATPADVEDIRAEELDGALLFAAGNTADPSVIEALVAAGAKVNVRGGELIAVTPLHLAAWGNENPAVLQALLTEDEAAGARTKSINSRTNFGSTPLHLAAQYSDNPGVITTLAQAGASVDAQDEEGQTPLRYAVRSNGNPTIVMALAEAGADVNARDQVNETLLHFAARNTENFAIPAIIEVLAAAGADVNAQNNKQWTPLHYAVRQSRDPDIIEALLVAGAQADVPNEDGATSLDFLRASDTLKYIYYELADPGATNAPITGAGQ